MTNPAPVRLSRLPWNRATRLWGGVLMSWADLQGSWKGSLLTSRPGPEAAGSYRQDGRQSNSVRWMQESQSSVRSLAVRCSAMHLSLADFKEFW